MFFRIVNFKKECIFEIALGAQILAKRGLKFPQFLEHTARIFSAHIFFFAKNEFFITQYFYTSILDYNTSDWSSTFFSQK